MGIETVAAPVLDRHSSDDEILGLTTHIPRKSRHGATDGGAPDAAPELSGQLDLDFADADPVQGKRGVRRQDGPELGDAVDDAPRGAESPTTQDAPAKLREVFKANPELQHAWRDAQEYRETFATPAEARAATALLGDLNRMDTLFFSKRPEDHAELARAVAQLEPAAFASLAREMANLAMGATRGEGEGARQTARLADGSRRDTPREVSRATDRQDARLESRPNQDSRAEARPEPIQPDATQRGLTPAQTEFFHTTNAAAVESVLEAIETQVERLLPEGIAKTARNRVVGEIYREIDATLRGNRVLGQQMRDAFRSGALDDDHRRAIVSLVTGRARQALPAVAKRVLDEWTTTVVSANHARRARQRSAERRVDIAGSGGAGNDGRRAATSRDIDYARMSDADILNL
ncbi:MAG: hypothetical protein WA306_18375 [Candidatus Acidiferrales bacterium]